MPSQKTTQIHTKFSEVARGLFDFAALFTIDETLQNPVLCNMALEELNQVQTNFAAAIEELCATIKELHHD